MGNTTDMTVGSPTQGILRFALPLILGYILQQMYLVIDAAIVGRWVGVEALAAIGASSSITFLIMGFCNGSCAGFAIPVAQTFGAHDYSKMRAYVAHSLRIGAIIAVVLTVLTAVFCARILRVVNTPDDIFHDAYIFLLLTFLTIPFTIAYNLLSGFIRALGNSRQPFYFLIVSSMVNIVLDVILILGMGMGVEGVAIPTLISRAVGAFIILGLAAQHEYVLHITPRSVTHLEGGIVKSILRIGIPSACENSLFQLGRVLVVSMISLFGTVHISANAVANNLDAVGAIIGTAMGLAVITVVGRCVGAQDLDQAVYYTKKLMLWDYIAQGVANAAVILSLGVVLNMYTLSPETRALSAELVTIHCAMGILIWPAAFVLPNALRAANDVKFTMIASIASMIAWRLAFSWILCVNLGWGAVGVWWAMVIDWACRTVCFVGRFASGAWKKKAMKTPG